jgi:hypothetical protein
MFRNTRFVGTIHFRTNVLLDVNLTRDNGCKFNNYKYFTTMNFLSNTYFPALLYTAIYCSSFTKLFFQTKKYCNFS